MWVLLHGLAAYGAEAGVPSEGHSQRISLDFSVQVIFFGQGEGML